MLTPHKNVRCATKKGGEKNILVRKISFHKIEVAVLDSDYSYIASCGFYLSDNIVGLYLLDREFISLVAILGNKFSEYIGYEVVATALSMTAYTLL